MRPATRALVLAPLVVAPLVLAPLIPAGARGEVATASVDRPPRAVIAPIPPARPEPSVAAPATTAPAVAELSPPAPSGVRLRAGLIEDNPADPEFPAIVPGSVQWSSALSLDDRRTVAARVELARNELKIRFDLEIGVLTPGARTVLKGWLTGLPGARLSEMPAARRGAAMEGEPLAGRIVEDDAARFQIELSDDPRDVTNNWRRLTQPAWLDLRLRLGDGRSVVLTLEKARAGNDLLLQLAPASP